MVTTLGLLLSCAEPGGALEERAAPRARTVASAWDGPAGPDGPTDPMWADLPVESDQTSLAGDLSPIFYDSAGARRVVVRRSADSPFSELVVGTFTGGGWSEEVRVSGPASPDRPAISPDGRTVGFVSGVSGISSVWIIPFDGSTPAVQLTNLRLEDVKRLRGEAPIGFLESPVDDSLTFDGDELTWNTSYGQVAVQWR